MQTPQILIVGKDDVARRYVNHSLARGSFRCTCVNAVGDARTVARESAMDVALLDMASFDRQDAVKLAQWFLREVRDLPVVLVAEPSEARSALGDTGLGAVDCLRQPVSNEELYEAVDRAVRWRRQAALKTDGAERWSREMEQRTEALVRSCVEAGIGSTPALETWIATLYMRDAWTLAHVGRVAHLSAMIGRTLGLSDAAIEHLRRAALLHDVGRLTIPEELLHHPEPLTADQRALMRRHTDAAGRVAESTPVLKPLADTLFAIRERYNGSGYPLGLHGRQIPIGARIIAVAEAFDALRRSGSEEPGTVDAINAELVRSGSCFDPAVVRAWLRCADAAVVALAEADQREQAGVL